MTRPGAEVQRAGGRPRAVMAIAVYGWVNGTLAAGVARLDERLDLNATTVAAHLAAFAVGLIVAGTGWLDRMPHRRLAPLVFAAALVPFLAAPHVAVSLGAAVVLGGSGSLTLAAAQTTITSDLRGADDRLLIVANVLAALTAAAAAFVIGNVPLDRIAISAVGPMAASVWVVHRQTVPLTRPADRSRPRRPNGTEFAGLILVGLVVAIEFSVGNQIVNYLDSTGSQTFSSTGPAVLFLGLAVGRTAAALAPLAASHAVPTMTAALVVVVAALTVLQLTTMAPLRIAALAATGAALGPLYPLAIASTLNTARDRQDTSTHTTAAIGAALIGTPALVGATVDIISPAAGFVVLTTLAVVASLLSASRHGDQNLSNRAEG